MQIKTLSVTYARTFNLGDYNSARFEVAVAAEFEPGDELAAVEAELWRVAKESLKAQALPVIRKRQEEIGAIRASLPEGLVAGD